MSACYDSLRVLILLLLLEIGSPSFSQVPGDSLQLWRKWLSVKEDYPQENYTRIYNRLFKLPWPAVTAILDEVEKEGDSKNERFIVRIRFLRANLWWRRNGWSVEQVEKPMKESLQKAYELDDKMLQAQVCAELGQAYAIINRLEPSVLCLLNTCTIWDQLGMEKTHDYGHLQYVLGYELYFTGEYKECIYHTFQALKNRIDTLTSLHPMNAWNTIGLAYVNTGQYDSALYAFAESMKWAEKRHDRVWFGVISGDMGEAYFFKQEYRTAKPLLLNNYTINKTTGEWDVAGYSLQLAARIALKEGKRDSALVMAREAMRLLTGYQKKGYFILINHMPAYWQEMYYTMADVYRAMGKTDSFYRYFQMYRNLHDSLNLAKALSRTEIARMKLAEQRNIYQIQNMRQAEEAAKQQRNLIIAAILSLSAIALLIFNRERTKSNFRRQLAMQEKASAEAEVAAAREQLRLFTKSIIEKTDLVGQLEAQLQQRKLSEEQQELVAQLLKQTILTEEDWEKFKMLFGTIYPAFFNRLKQKAPDISLAEQRIGALIRLQLSGNQMASMLGISADGVRKTRWRLRQRLRLIDDHQLEELISGI
jgi:hypothetical protein